jgi:predicted DNA-binding transcriptional regulator YafY
MKRFIERVSGTRVWRAQQRLNGIVKERIDLVWDQVMDIWGELGRLGEEMLAYETDLDVLERRVELLEDEIDGMGDPIEREVQRAIHRERVIAFDYDPVQDRGPVSELRHRWVSPYEIIERGGETMVGGWDHTREAYRTFRLDRLSGLTTGTFQEFRPPEISS